MHKKLLKRLNKGLDKLKKRDRNAYKFSEVQLRLLIRDIEEFNKRK